MDLNEREHQSLDRVIIAPKWRQALNRIARRDRRHQEGLFVTPSEVESYYLIRDQLLIGAAKVEGRNLNDDELMQHVKLLAYSRRTGDFSTMGALERHVDQRIEESNRILSEIVLGSHIKS